VSLGGGVDDLIDSLHGEVEGHELANRVQASQRSTNGETGETRFCDRTVDDSLFAEAVEQTFCDFVTRGVSAPLSSEQLVVLAR
jgi:hypothetical protein